MLVSHTPAVQVPDFSQARINAVGLSRQSWPPDVESIPDEVGRCVKLSQAMASPDNGLPH